MPKGRSLGTSTLEFEASSRHLFIPRGATAPENVRERRAGTSGAFGAHDARELLPGGLGVHSVRGLVFAGDSGRSGAPSSARTSGLTRTVAGPATGTRTSTGDAGRSRGSGPGSLPQGMLTSRSA